jgi:hypothetical protein
MSLEILRDTKERRRNGSHRPAALYEFKLDRFQELGGGVVFSF